MNKDSGNCRIISSVNSLIAMAVLVMLVLVLGVSPALSQEDATSDDLLGGDLLSGSDDDSSLLGDGDAEGFLPKDDETPKETGDRAHRELYAGDRFPSAAQCRSCHPGQYREWSVSPHAYAQLSPVFNAMHATIVKETSGTNGDFCIRCHTPVGMALGEPIVQANEKRHPVSREGVTCVVCHRLEKPFGKVSGRMEIMEGDLFSPVFGPSGNEGLRKVIDDPDTYQTVSERGQAGRVIHQDAVKFKSISEPGFCATCHDVTFVNGFRLEEAFSEYKASPAAKEGTTCQDCHMGKFPGLPKGYWHASVARVNDVYTAKRKRTNHMIAGPDYSIVHPGIFPHNPEATELASLSDWNKFDYKSGWGGKKFEAAVSSDYEFPLAWSSPDDRIQARKILKRQFDLLREVARQRKAILRVGYQLSDIEVTDASPEGLGFKVEVSNGARGHNVPTGFIAERLVFLRVTVRNSKGKVVYKSGDLDPNGDVRDSHSLYVHDGKLELDKDLFSLQSLFMVRLNRGGEREQVLAVNYSADPLVYNRPETRPSVLFGGTAGARIHRRGIVPEAGRWAKYWVDSENLGAEGPYTIRVKLIAAMVPVNLIDRIKAVGFDYGMSAKDVAEAVVAGHQVLREKKAVVRIESSQ